MGGEGALCDTVPVPVGALTGGGLGFAGGFDEPGEALCGGIPAGVAAPQAVCCGVNRLLHLGQFRGTPRLSGPFNFIGVVQCGHETITGAAMNKPTV